MIDLRKALNGISDVIVNRPAPLRMFDQIYMKAADMLMQVEFCAPYFASRKVLFVGDGDAIALSLAHLHRLGLFEGAEAPMQLTVLDFDERVVSSINRFAQLHRVEDLISAKLYNVIDPLPAEVVGSYDCFYTNPPFSASNRGASARLFLARGLLSLGTGGQGVLVVADGSCGPWACAVLQTVQSAILLCGGYLEEVVPNFHTYHLDDDPQLSSCNLVLRRFTAEDDGIIEIARLSTEELGNFYGLDRGLRVRYIREQEHTFLGYEEEGLEP